VRPFQEASTFRTLADDYLIPGREPTLLKAQWGHFPQKYTLLSLFRINCYAKHIPAYLGNIDEATGKLALPYLDTWYSGSRKKQRPIRNTVPNLLKPP